MPKCQVCRTEYEEVDYQVVWPWPGSCRCTAWPPADTVAKAKQRARDYLNEIGYYKELRAWHGASNRTE